MTEQAPHSLFIADLHLQVERPALTAAFFSFLETQAVKAEALYILGDFFNLWIGDDDDSPLNLSVSQRLKQLSDQGTRVFLMHGNRDFLMGERFVESCGATLLHSPYRMSLYEKDTLLMHGDSLCTDDVEYQQFRTMVRSPQWQAQVLSRSLEERRAFAAQLRAQTKAMSSNKAEDIMDVNANAVAERMREHGCLHLIHGHTHRPAIHEFTLDGAPARRMVLGDWGSQGWYLQVNAQGEQLHSFTIPDIP